MSRLRKAVLRYSQLGLEDEVELLDSSVQDDVILELKTSLMKSKQPPATFINLIIGTVVVLNLMLLTIPYYKSKENRVLSLLSILCSLVNYLVLKYEKFDINIGRKRLWLISFVTSIVILAFKVANFETADIIYTVPLLISFGIYTLVSDEKDLENEIKSLEKLRYNYKEA